VSQSLLFVCGAVVSIVVFTGAFLYAMLSFGKWADKAEN
jgi:hypothetical protein